MHLVWYGLYEYNAAWLDFSFFSSSFIFFSLYSVEDNATPVFTCGWVLLLSGVGKGGGGGKVVWRDRDGGRGLGKTNVLK